MATSKRGSDGPFNSPADVGGRNPIGEVSQGGGSNVLHEGVNPPGDAGVEEDGAGVRSAREVLSILQSEMDSSQGWTGTRLADSRRAGMNNYFANPRGDERDGRSQVVTREVFEVVEQAMPDMMEIFTASNEVAQFLPSTEEDVEGSKQATDACNYVFRKNDGFMVLYTMFKDAFIQKNGIVKVYWDESSEWTVENYEGKTLLEFFELLEDQGLIATAVTAYTDNDGEREEIDLQVLLGEEGVQYDPLGVYFDAKCKRRVDKGTVKMDNIPPEEFAINRDARGLDDPTTRFCAHRVRTTASALIAQGMDPELVRTIPSAASSVTTDYEINIRASQDDSSPQMFAYRQDEQRTIYVIEGYVRVDLDGDGISEWHKIIAGGDYAEVLLETEQVNYHPFASVTPIPVPHRFYGLSFSDVTDDLQQINTTLWRQYLDSLYLANDPRMIVRSSGEADTAVPLCNLEQLLNSEVGSYVEEYAENAIRPFPTVTNAQHILPAFELHEKSVQARIGVSPEAAAVNPDSISKHTFGAMVQSSAAARRLAMYARVFANTGVKRIFELIYKELMQHQMAPMMLELRGKWTPVNPTDWSRQMDCQVNVGLGHGSRMEKSTHSQTVLEVQKQVAEAGLTNIVDQDKIYNSCSTLTENLGFKDVGSYFNDPAGQPPVEEEPSAEEKAIEAQQQIDIMKVELDRQKMELERYKAQVEAKKVELDHEAKMWELRIKAAAAGGEGKGPLDDPSFRIPPPPPAAPPQPTGVGGLTLEQAGIQPNPDEMSQMGATFDANRGI